MKKQLNTLSFSELQAQSTPGLIDHGQNSACVDGPKGILAVMPDGPRQMSTVTDSAREVLRLLGEPGVLRELEQYFKRDWEIASELGAMRETFEARELGFDEEQEKLGRQYDALEDAARELVHAIDEADPERICEAVKTARALF